MLILKYPVDQHGNFAGEFFGDTDHWEEASQISLGDHAAVLEASLDDENDLGNTQLSSPDEH